jgi:hypothetical protein
MDPENEIFQLKCNLLTTAESKMDDPPHRDNDGKGKTSASERVWHQSFAFVYTDFYLNLNLLY